MPRWSSDGAQCVPAFGQLVFTLRVLRGTVKSRSHREHSQLAVALGHLTEPLLAAPWCEGTDFYQGWLKSCDGTGLAPIGSFPVLIVPREKVAPPTGAAQ